MTIAENLNNGAIELKRFNIESPNLKSRMIMQYVLNKPHTKIDSEILTKINFFIIILSENVCTHKK